MDNKFELILPLETIDKLKARAATLSVDPSELIERALERVLTKKARGTCASLPKKLEQSTPPWPSNFDERLVGSALLWKTVKRSGEDYLLQLNGAKMDIIETICRNRRINYEEAIREAVVAALSGQASQDQDPRTEELPDWDGVDRWKQ